MHSAVVKSTLALAIGALAGLGGVGARADTPKHGGTLTFVTASKIPSYDGHKESTFGVIHPISPFYSLLIRINPENPSSPTDFVCDLCVGQVPEPTENGTRYTFKIRDDVKFHDGTALTAHDVATSFNRLAFPDEDKGVQSVRKAYFTMVESITATDDHTVEFKLKHPSGAFLAAVGMPFNYVYAKKDLEQDPRSPEKNINGTGPFKFVEHQPGAFVTGVRYDGYHHEGQPYLEGFKSIVAPQMAVRLQAIRGGRADIEFRGFPPKSVDELVQALGKEITVQESDWNCGLLFTINHKKKPFDDARVRRALTLAVDRWAAQDTLSKIAIVKTAAGIVFPGHPLAATKEELQKLAGFWPDIEKSREEARRLLKEAGAEGLKFTLNNRSTDQPYRIVGTWLIGEWKKIGLDVDQKVLQTPQWFEEMRGGVHEVTTDANCQTVVNPLLDVSKYLGSASSNRGFYDDQVLEDLYTRMNQSGDVNEQYRLMREFEKRAIDDEMHEGLTLWWRRINPHRSYVKGWKTSPSHYLNQQLDNVWLDKSS